MNLYRFEIKRCQLEEVTAQIESHGGTILFSSEDEDSAEIYAHIPPEAPLDLLRGFPAELPPIDWAAQWALHGVAQLNVNNVPLKLIAGPGFGDLSHPTTQAMIEMMEKHLPPNALVVDLGCGSGILSLAALALGAKQVIGIDIDPDALRHSSENARANGFESRCTFCLPQDFDPPKEKLFLLMNMITSEQKLAWPTVHHCKIGGMITSGILQSERETYLGWLKGWKVEDEAEKGGWLSLFLT